MSKYDDEWNARQTPRGPAARLLSAGRSESPSADTRGRAMLALGIGTAAIGTTSAATASAGTAAGKIASIAPAAAGASAAAGTAAGTAGTVAAAGGAAKGGIAAFGLTKTWILVSAIGIGAVGAGVAVTRLPSTSPPQERAVVAAPQNKTPTMPAQTARPVEAPALGTPVETPALHDVPAPPRAPQHSESAAPAKTAKHAESTHLNEELADLDRARAALRGGDSAGCLGALDTYVATHPHGALRFEADVLRAEALVQSGRTREGSALAARLLERTPSGPYADRLKRLTTKE
jgi:hypothetical protein